ncbi:unnamed protein product [Schistocephalus solidus]|uniref:Uncharacterized protein n=1 Tax=Schistocephalus solidus TaxID=70667 RepID=A0A183S929_SCHSO|nr:unnamed protein product [Schistocephalus solidus]
MFRAVFKRTLRRRAQKGFLDDLRQIAENMREMYPSDSSSSSWHLNSSSCSSYDDSDSEISSADEEISWNSDISDVAANNFSSTPTLEEEPTVREAMSSWAVRSRIPLIHLSSLLKIIRWLTSDLPADARTLLGGASDVSTVTAMGSGEYVRLGLV